MLKKLKALLFGTAVAASQAGAENTAPPVDVNVAVTNPNLVAAIERLKGDVSDEAKDALLVELNKSNYLAAIFTDEMHASEPDENGKSVIEKDSTIKVLNTSDNNGNIYLPLFTDWDALRKYIDQPVNTLVFPPQDAWHWALEMGDYHGIVINPAENALPLNKEQIQYLASQVAADKANRYDWKNDPVESVVGIHLLSDYGSSHEFLGADFAIEKVMAKLEALDWQNNFYQFIVVIEPGVSMEVGGSTNGVDGLSGVYRDQANSIHAVTLEAPTGVDEMKEILISFLLDNGAWKKKFKL